jgi:YihY family inner membrane protein
MGGTISAFAARHPTIRAFAGKVLKDNIGFLASALSWTLLTSIVPIVVGLTAITGFLLRDKPSAQHSVIGHLSAALQGVLSPSQIAGLVSASIQHSSTLGLIGIVGIIWGGSNVGGTISTVFQPIFEVRGRPFLREKLIDIVMIVVFSALMMVIIAATASITLLNRLFVDVPLTGQGEFALATLISLLAAFLLFAIIYLVFPNTDPRFRFGNIWLGAAVAAILFQSLTFIWPLYTSLAHFQRYTAVLASLLVLATWLYSFSIILMVGAELVAFRALSQAARDHEPIGPAPDGNVPQHGIGQAWMPDLEVERRPGVEGGVSERTRS